MTSVSTCLWFDGQAEQAAAFYTGIVPNSRILRVVHNVEGGAGEPGSVLLVDFELDGQRFMGLNGGPQFTFDEAISISITCDSQAEIDRLWDALTADGGDEGPCGWLKDRYGLSWQIDSAAMHEMLVSPDQAAAARAVQAMMGMQKLDVQALQDAFAGTS